MARRRFGSSRTAPPAQQEIFPDAPAAADPSALPISVIRSAKRKKTSSARLIEGTIEVRVPAGLPSRQEAAVVADLVARVHKANEMAERELDLTARTARLGAAHNLPVPDDIRWVSNQNKRWGSCTPVDRTIRISSRLRNVPAYVLDAVIVHELAHLVEPGHGPEFRALEDRFAQRERADGFLEAMSLGCADAEFMAD